jgi:hypothetical protein
MTRSYYIPKRPQYTVKLIATAVITLNSTVGTKWDQYIQDREVRTMQDLEDLVTDLMNDSPGDNFDMEK